ncbi:MAG: hypothetical protein V1907_03940 [Candidatus Kerfeldbacteria bacterium]
MAKFAQTKGKAIGYGLLMFLVWMALLFITSMVNGTEGMTDIDFNSTKMVISGVVVAALMGIVAYLFCRKLRLDTKRDALIAGVLWVVILVAFQLFIMIPNGTTKVLRAWAMDLPYITIIVGAWLGVRKGSISNPQQPRT